MTSSAGLGMLGKLLLRANASLHKQKNKNLHHHFFHRDGTSSNLNVGEWPQDFGCRARE